MNVGELIEQLQKHPDNWTVRIYHDEIRKITHLPYEVDVIRASVFDEGEIGLILDDQED